MKIVNDRVLGVVFGAAALLVLPVVLAIPGDAVVDQSRSFEELWNSTDPFDQLAKKVTIEAVNEVGGFKCLEADGVSFCLHPDTDPAIAEELLRNLPTYAPAVASGKVEYNKAGRWSTTASGPTGVEGDPITLTWSFVPDGTICDGIASNMFAVFTAAFGGTGWQEKMRNAMQRWDDVMGANYIEVSDDGAVWPNSMGVLGLRGDCRICARHIDGSLNVLGYTYYPNGGDTILDSDDVNYFHIPTQNFATLKNVLAHEHGHGFGLGHVIPTNCTKLMEPYACGTVFLGPQDDDIRGGQRLYGDKRENNDTQGTATNCGVLLDTLVFDTLSIDRATDLDWFLLNASGALTVMVDPIGSTYMVGNDGGTASPISTDSILDPDFCLLDNTGAVLDSVYAGSFGATEVLTNRPLPYDGDYFIRVFRGEPTGAGIQRYKLTLIKSVATDVAVSDVPTPVGLQLHVAPNPFNPTTTAKFFTPSAGPYSVSVFDVSGRLSRTFEGRSTQAGWTEVTWDGKDDAGASAASGVYLMRVDAGARTETARAILVR